MAMTRRQWFPFAFGLVAAPSIVSAPPERARAFIAPYCPRCGSCVEFLEHPQTVEADVPVRCGCGWRGVSQMTHVVQGGA